MEADATLLIVAGLLRALVIAIEALACFLDANSALFPIERSAILVLWLLGTFQRLQRLVDSLWDNQDWNVCGSGTSKADLVTLAYNFFALRVLIALFKQFLRVVVADFADTVVRALLLQRLKVLHFVWVLLSYWELRNLRDILRWATWWEWREYRLVYGRLWLLCLRCGRLGSFVKG